jgi:hypothetical protein
MLTANGTWKLMHPGKFAFFASFASFADKKLFPRSATPFDTRTGAVGHRVCAADSAPRVSVT